MERFAHAARWTKWPFSTVGRLFLAGATGIVTWFFVYGAIFTPLQRYYWDEYLNTEMYQGTRGDYTVLEVVGRQGSHRIAVDSDLVVAPRHAPQPIPFILSAQARHSGGVDLAVDTVHYGSAEMHQVLATSVFDGWSATELSFPAWGAGLGVFVLCIFLSRESRRGRRAFEEGQRLKGPQILTVTEFNQWSRADGVGFLTTHKNETFRIPASFESSHMMIMGDSGAGKSILQRQILLQIAERNESAIIYDPALEYTPQFYEPDRGDLILNPLDARCPHWCPSDEVVHEAEALTLATSLFPDKPHENAFFVEGPRKIFAYLLTLRPNPEELVRWMSHENELDAKLKGMELATFIYRGAGPQRGGVLGALNMVADSLKMLPKESETKLRWTTVDWSQRQSGWIFLTSVPRFRQRLLPLTSLWLDTLVLRLMNQGDSTTRKAWFILDELASLQRLPQLHTALTENRKSNNPVVIGFQGRSQLEVRYGHEAETMLSQPATKIFLHTSEPRAAKWISDAIGEVEVERLKESASRERFPHLRASRAYYTERRTEPLMLPSEISGLSRLHAVAKVDNFVVRFSFPYISPLRIQPGFLPRESVSQSSADVEIGKTTRRSDSPSGKELKPAKARKIAANLEPFFDE
jgi:hypothetical protein